jgi:hypothetical protein
LALRSRYLPPQRSLQPLTKDSGMSTSKKRMAGKSSGITRAKFAKLRQSFVLSAFERLEPKYQRQPFSEEALDALEEEFRREHQDEDGVRKPGKSVLPPEQSDRLQIEAVNILVEGKYGTRSVFSASRDTLIKDLKALGIRSKLRKQRSG